MRHLAGRALLQTPSTPIGPSREVQAIRALFADPALVLWPGASLFYHGLRTGALRMALSTFYRYTVLLGLKRRWRPPIPKTTGIRAERPNAYLHVDSTYWELEPGTKASIVLVSDNFSKAILGWCVALGKQAQHVVVALRDAISTIRQHHPALPCAVLVADGGGENHAVSVEELLRTTDHPTLTKIIAQKDIRFSNSSVEAINRIYKRHLRYHQPRTLAAVMGATEAFVRDYNTLRPHGSLKGLTPMEAYTRPDLKLDLRQAVGAARTQRMAANKQVNCSLCPPGTI